MPSITTWYRLDSRSRSDTAETSIAAEVRDPLWLLARQWQFGEFEGTDGGSPIQARTRTESATINRFCAGAAPSSALAVDYAATTTPLEAVVESEPVRGGPAQLGLAAESGQHLLRVIGSIQSTATVDYRAAVLAAFPLAAPTTPGAAPDPYVSHAQEQLMGGDDGVLLRALYGRAPDGLGAFAVLSKDPLACFSSADAADRPALITAVNAWVAWHRSAIFVESARTSWADGRLEYQFAVAGRLTDREVVLTAPAYDGRGLDWHTFDAANDATLGGQQISTSPVQSVLATPTGFRGMPATRCWEFEDASLDVGGVDAGPTDLARLLVLDFALIFGGDWFTIPVDVPVGTLTCVRSLVVTDTFGVQRLVRSVHDAAPATPWSMFQPGGLPNVLLVPPTAVQAIESEPLEDVLLFRDDGADVAWAVERLVETPSGRSISREHEAPATNGNPGQYILATSVPRNWIPLIPVTNGSEVRLIAGTVLPAKAADATLPIGRLLTSAPPLTLFDEEVPREGLQFRRKYRYARTHGGQSLLWLSRTTNIGLGQGVSRLEYDTIL